MRTLLREFEQHYLRMSSHPHGRTPRSDPARRVYVQRAEPLEPISKPAKDAARGQSKRKDLSAMSVPGDLQAHARPLHNGQPAWHMVQKDAGFVRAKPHPLQSCLQANWAGRVPKGHSGNVQAIHGNSFIVQDPDAGASDRHKVVLGTAKLLVVAGRKVDSEWRDKLLEWSCQLIEIGL